MKYTCERTRELSQDGQTQRGCVFNLNKSNLDPKGDGSGMRNWLMANVGDQEDDPEGDLAKKGPCQPADVCPNQEFRDQTKLNNNIAFENANKYVLIFHQFIGPLN